jgi:hypothetical protein
MQERTVSETNGERFRGANLSLFLSSPAFQPAVSRAADTAEHVAAPDA